jgi:hypothetical protein
MYIFIIASNKRLLKWCCGTIKQTHETYQIYCDRILKIVKFRKEIEL